MPLPWSLSFSYPGISSIYTLDYTVGLGITPGIINLTCHPNSSPSARGTLTFGVTNGTTTRFLTLRDCRLDEMVGKLDSSNRNLRLRFYDRRWSWTNSYATDGHFNQTDKHGKLRPKTVRSLWQLTSYLFKKMGENYPASASATLTGDAVGSVIVHDGGKGYLTPPTVLFVSGTPATGVAAIGIGNVTGVNITNGGSGYISPPSVVFTGGGGTGAAGIAVMSGGQVVGVTISAPGTGYTSPPDVSFVGGFPSAAGVATVVGGTVTGVTVTSPGSGFTSPPRVVIDVPAGYFVDVQPGLAAPAAPGVPAPGPQDEVIDARQDFLRCGEDHTRSRSNPLVEWASVPAAVAMAQVLERFGRTPVFDPITDLTTVQKLGTGTGLPAGRLLSSSPAIDLEAVPEEVIVKGGPTRYQIQVQTRAVMLDHRDNWVALEDSSLAPEITAPARKMLTRAKISSYNAGTDYSVTLNRVTFTASSGTHASAADVYTALETAINASVDPRVAGWLSVTASSPDLEIEGDINGYVFSQSVAPGEKWKTRCPIGPIPDPTDRVNEWDVLFLSPPTWLPTDTLSVTIDGNTFTSPAGLTFDQAVANVAGQINLSAGYGAGNGGGGHLVVSGLTVGLSITVTAAISNGTVKAIESQSASGTRGFHNTDPYSFANIKVPTGFLNYEEARSLARATAYTCFQIVPVNPADWTDKSIPMPGGLDPITDITQLLLLDSRVEQIAPRPGDANVIDPNIGQPVAEERYNGYSSDRATAAYGTINVACWDGMLYRPAGGLGLNTDASQQIHHIGITVFDRARGVFQFSRPLYLVLGEDVNAVIIPAAPVVELGVLVLDPETWVPNRFSLSVAIPGATAPPVVRVFDDIREEVIGEYDQNHTLVRWRTNDADPIFRATTYANEVATSYQAPASATQTYNNMEEVHPSGIVRMVMWAFTRDGFSTIASANTEVSKLILDFGRRRREENAPPDNQRALENFMSQPAIRALPQNAFQSIRNVFQGL